jgi:hypothetical protein
MQFLGRHTPIFFVQGGGVASTLQIGASQPQKKLDSLDTEADIVMTMEINISSTHDLLQYDILKANSLSVHPVYVIFP